MLRLFIIYLLTTFSTFSICFATPISSEQHEQTSAIEAASLANDTSAFNALKLENEKMKDIVNSQNELLEKLRHLVQENKKLQDIINIQHTQIEQLDIERDKYRQESLIIQKSKNDNDNERLSYAEWAAIVLGCVTVIVTVLAVVIAILSFWGFRSITTNAKVIAKNISNQISSQVAKDEVVSRINNVAKEELAKLIDEGELSEHLENAVDMIYRNQRETGNVGGYGFNKYAELNDDEDS